MESERAAAEGLGATVADSPVEAVAGADVVVTMLADGEAVGSVMESALPAVEASAIWAQTSTVGVAWTDRLARATEALEAVSREVRWLGDEPGMASRLKLVANHWLLVSIENVAETVALAEGLGVDPRRFLEVIEGAPFDMAYAHWKAAMMLEGEFPAAFALRHARKDIGLVLDAGGEAGVELALAGASHARFGEAIDRGFGAEDFAATYRVAGARAV